MEQQTKSPTHVHAVRLRCTLQVAQQDYTAFLSSYILTVTDHFQLFRVSQDEIQ